jgi:hypothetical protein
MIQALFELLLLILLCLLGGLTLGCIVNMIVNNKPKKPTSYENWKKSRR